MYTNCFQYVHSFQEEPCYIVNLNDIYKFEDILTAFARAKARFNEQKERRQIEFINTFDFYWKELKTSENDSKQPF